MDMNDVRFLYQRMPAKVYGRNGESVDGIVLLGEFPTGITVVFNVEQLTGFMQDAVCEIGVVAIAVNKIVSMFPPSYDKLTVESQFSLRFANAVGAESGSIEIVRADMYDLHENVIFWKCRMIVLGIAKVWIYGINCFQKFILSGLLKPWQPIGSRPPFNS